MRKGDEAIAAAAVDRFSWSNTVPHEAFEVGVEKGWVTVSGEGNWHFERTPPAVKSATSLA